MLCAGGTILLHGSFAQDWRTTGGHSSFFALRSVFFKFLWIIDTEGKDNNNENLYSPDKHGRQQYTETIITAQTKKRSKARS